MLISPKATGFFEGDKFLGGAGRRRAACGYGPFHIVSLLEHVRGFRARGYASPVRLPPAASGHARLVHVYTTTFLMLTELVAKFNKKLRGTRKSWQRGLKSFVIKPMHNGVVARRIDVVRRRSGSGYLPRQSVPDRTWQNVSAAPWRCPLRTFEGNRTEFVAT
jgi:hypothetical protein